MGGLCDALPASRPKHGRAYWPCVLLNHLVCGRQQRFRDRKSKRLGGLRSPRGSVILDDNGLAEGRPVIKSGLTAQVYVGHPEQIPRSGLFGRMSAPTFPHFVQTIHGPNEAR